MSDCMDEWHGHIDEFILIFLSRYQLLIPSLSFSTSHTLSQFIFTSHTSSCYTHSTHAITPLCEPESNELSEISSTISSINVHNTVAAAIDTDLMSMGSSNGCIEYRYCQATYVPSFLVNVIKPKVIE